MPTYITHVNAQNILTRAKSIISILCIKKHLNICLFVKRNQIIDLRFDMQI